MFISTRKKRSPNSLKAALSRKGVQALSASMLAVKTMNTLSASPGFHSAFVKSDGSLWTMGNNEDGQLGINSQNDANVSTEVSLGSLSMMVSIGNPMSGPDLFINLAKHETFLEAQETKLQSAQDFVARMQELKTLSQTASNADVSIYNIEFGSLQRQLYDVSQTSIGGENLFAQFATDAYGNPNFAEVVFGNNALSHTFQIQVKEVGEDVSLGGSISLGSVSLGMLDMFTINRGSLLSAVTINSSTLAASKFSDGATLGNGISSFAAPSPASTILLSDVSLGVLGQAASNLAVLRSQNGSQLTGLRGYHSQKVDYEVAKVAIGGGHSIFILKGDYAYTTGRGKSGQLANGGSTNQSNYSFALSNVKHAAAGENHSLFLRNDGSLDGSGGNDFGQLGLSHDNNQSWPTQILPSGVKSIAVGSNHSLVVKEDGSLWGTGANIHYQLGLNDTSNRNQLTQIVSSGVRSAAAGNAFSLFLEDNGSLWGMGASPYGQLGMGDLNSQFTPVQIIASGVRQLSAGQSHSLFLKNDGSVWGMGANQGGQLGLGGLNQTTVPVKLFNHGAKEIHAGRHHSLILTMDGTLWGTGLNSKGELGLGDLTGRNTFTQITTGVMRLADVMSNEQTVSSAANLEMIWVEPGTFTMGSPLSEANRGTDETEHNVTLTKGLYLGKYEVTQAQYEAVMTGNTNSLSATPSNWSGNPNRPVEQVSWDDVQIFLTRLNASEQAAGRLPAGWSYVLPTESQWEYTCRAGTTTVYSWGNTITSANANYNSNIGQTANVGQYAANPWGFFDMHGNVYEWTADRYGTYPTSNPVIDPRGAASGSKRVLRGGSRNNDGTYLRSARRDNITPSFRNSNIGFRLAFKQITTPPTNLNSITPLTIAENQLVGTVVGEFNATDPDAGATLTYHLVSGAGDGNNSLFTLETNGTLKTASTFDYESNASTYAIRVQAKDEFNATVEGNFTVTLTDQLNEGPPIQVDGNSTEVKTTGTINGTNWVKKKTIVLPQQTLVNEVRNEIKNDSTKSAWFTECKIKFFYSDGSSLESTIQTHTSNYYLSKTYLNPDQLKEVSSVEVWLRQNTSGNDKEAWERNTILYGYSNNATNTVPVFSSGGGSSSYSLVVFENDRNVTTVSASDPEGLGISYTITGGSDSSKFSLNSGTGKLIFVHTPNFEYPRDSGADNQYEVVVRASDGALYSEQTILITVSDLNEDSKVAMNLSETKTVSGTDGTNLTKKKTLQVGNRMITQVENEIKNEHSSGSTTGCKMKFIYSDGNSTFGSLKTEQNREYAKKVYLNPQPSKSVATIEVWLDTSNGSSNKEGFERNTIVYGTLITSVQVDHNSSNVSTDFGSDGIDWVRKKTINLGGRNISGVTNEIKNASTSSLWITESKIIFFYQDGSWDSSSVESHSSNSFAQKNYANPCLFKAVDKIEVWLRQSHGGNDKKAYEANTLVFGLNNYPPADLNSTAPLTLAENQPIGTVVGEFNATDPDAGATLTYYLVSGAGDGNNSLFTLEANGTLKTATTFDYETNASTYSIRVQAKDEHNATVEGNFTVTLTDLNEPPLILSPNSVSVPENSQQVMTLSASDPEGDTIRYFLSGAPDKDRFKLNPITGQLVLRSAPDYENPSDANGDGRYEIGLSVVAANDVQPSFQRANGGENPLYGLDIGATSSPVLGDLDADGDLDMIVGTSSGQFEFFLNEGNSTHLQLQRKTGGENPLYGLDIGATSSPVLGDLDADGDLDMIVGTSSGQFEFFLNEGNSTHLQLQRKTGGENPLHGLDIGATSSPVLGDLDADGDLDMIVGTSSGQFEFFLNEGNSTHLQLQRKTGGENPLHGHDIGATSSPALGDLDADGDLDMIVGTSSGQFEFFLNEGNSTHLQLQRKTSGENPLHGHDIGATSSPALGDLDADGDLDVIVGTSSGQFEFFVANRVRVSSFQMQINIYDVYETSLNQAPTDLNFTASLTIAENQPIGTIVGEFNATDPDAGATLTYHLVSGAGDTHNSLFTLEANGTLKTATTFDYETNASTYSIRVQAKDEHNATVEGNFTVMLTDVYEPSQPNHFVDLNATVNLEMIWVEPGTFSMGSPTSEVGRQSDREDEHNVSLTKGFYLGKYEVTQVQYEAVMTGNANSLSPTPSEWLGNPNRPVEKVSWDDAQVFLTRLNAQQAANLPAGWSYVLPTESQWEYACRAGTTTAYSWGNTIASSNANYNASGINQTRDVGQYAANPWGFFDMHGNVWEWTADRYQAAYPIGNPVVDPTGPTSGSARVRRGGSWYAGGTALRSAGRRGDAPSYRPNTLGFRIGFQNTNNSPTNLNFTTPLTIAENQPIGTVVGEFNATDTDAGATLTYHLVSGTGDGNNSLFTLETNGSLKTATTFDYEIVSSLTIRVKATDEFNATVEGNFTVTLTDVYEASPGQSNNDGNASSDGNSTTGETNPVADGNTTTDPTNPIVDGNTTTNPNNPVADGNSSNEGNATIPSPVPDYFRPIVDTLPAGEVNGTRPKLNGFVMDTGGLTPTEFGFLLSSRPNPKENASGVIRLAAESNASAFSAVAADLMAGKTYYFRAFAVNAEGIGYGFEESFETPAEPRRPTWIEAVPGTVKGWWTSPWLGNFYLNANGWARHEKLGWVFPVQSPSAGLWLWKEGFGWLWTDEAVYPFLYRNASGGWLYFYGRREETLLFYDYSTKDWIIRKDGQ